MKAMESARLCINRRLYHAPELRAVVDARGRHGYAALPRGRKGNQEAGESPARSRHCDRGANPIESHCSTRSGKAEGERGSGSQETVLPPVIKPDRGEDPEKEVSMDRVVGKVSLPVWLALIALALFVVLFDNGALLTSLLGEASGMQNYPHELFHDGRHVLGVPCH
jgi:Probable cobalt transporter subunit (CbtB)